jgi:hypothetical protein
MVLVHEIERSIVEGRELSFKRSIDGLFASNVFQKLIGQANFGIDERSGSSAGTSGSPGIGRSVFAIRIRYPGAPLTLGRR